MKQYFYLPNTIVQFITAFIILLPFFSSAQFYGNGLAGFTGKINKIEIKEYHGAVKDSSYWLIDTDKPDTNTIHYFNTKGQLIKDSILHPEQELSQVAYYNYKRGKLREITRKNKNNITTGTAKFEIDKKNSVIIANFDGTGKCINIRAWMYDDDKLLKYDMNGANCSSDELHEVFNFAYRYDSNKLLTERIRWLITDNRKKETTTYEVLERDKHSNPTVVLSVISFKGITTSTIQTYNYTYFNEAYKPSSDYKTLMKRSVVIAKREEAARMENERKAAIKEEQMALRRAKFKANRQAAFDNIITLAAGRTKKSGDSGLECVNTGKYNDKQRLELYPFNKAAKVVLISYNDTIRRTDKYSSATLSTKAFNSAKTVVLENNEIAVLTDILYNYGYAKKQPLVIYRRPECEEKSNAIVFLDKNNNPFEYIIINFGCEIIDYSNDEVKKTHGCSGKIDLLRYIFTALDITTE